MARFYFHATDGRELVRDTQGDEIRVRMSY